jgi:hypothetical protein
LIIVLGIVLGVLAFLVTSVTVGELVCHRLEAGSLPGLVAGLWVSWPLIHIGVELRNNFLHPVPRRYEQPLKHAFAKVQQILLEKTYNFGDKWRVVTANTVQRRIKALLRFTEEETKMHTDARLEIYTRKERVQRLLELDVQFKDGGVDSTIVQFDFSPKVEGLDFMACDSIIQEIMDAAEAALGKGEDASKAADSAIPAPPWWLLGLTAVSLMTLMGDVIKAGFN